MTLLSVLPAGYDTQIGEQGSALSAGQAQRIALARAVYRDPFLVVLDEPNSNLDSDGEEALTQAILGVRERKGIVVVIAHRPSAIAGVDRLMMMNQGPHPDHRPEGRGPGQSVATAAPWTAAAQGRSGQRERWRMKIPRFIHAISERLEKWATELLPAAAPGSSRYSIHRHLLAGGLIVLLLAGGVGGWAATTQIAGALIAQGSVVVDSNVKKVQHPTGGVVGKLNVQDGDRVKAGDILVQLDDTITRANLAIVTKGLDELAARKARLEAERDGAESVTFPRMLLAHAEDAPVAIAIANERKLFELRRTARLGQKAQLRQRITQLQDEISGQTAQQEAKAREISLIGKELDGVRELWKNNLVQITRLTALERDAARLEGERAQLIAAVAQTKGKISETELQIIQIDQDLSSEVAKDMREVDAKYGEFVERKVAAEDQLKRIDIRAPQDGVVLESKVHTVGGVISAGDAIMLIVPESDNLQVEAKINPRDIDQIQVGQPAMLRFSAFNLRTTPEINGTITRIAADATADQRTGQTYYNTRIAMTKGEIARLGEVKLIPGMPVEAFVQTGERSVMSYLIKPLQDQFMRAFREK